MGIVSPIGCGERRFWDALCKGQAGASPVDCLDTTHLPRTIACQVREPIHVEGDMGRASRLAVAAARQAVAGAGLELNGPHGGPYRPDGGAHNPAAGTYNQASGAYNPDGGCRSLEIDSCRVSVVVGTTMGETEFIEERLFSPGNEWLSSNHVSRILGGRPGSIAANVRADLFGGTGGLPSAALAHKPQVTSDGTTMDLYGACAAGNMAIAVARRQLLTGRCDLALAGGADGFSRLAFLGFMRLRVMASRICRPFDAERDGLLVGEGAAMFVLERESQARARGAPVRAYVAGCGMTCETSHPTRPDPDGDGLIRATRAALAEARLQPRDIDYVCAHGTGTPQNDAIEAIVLEQCFPEGVSFSSIKALTGHTMGAAAALEAACCVLILEHQTLIPTWHLEKLLQPCSLDAIQGRVRPARVRCVLNNAAGFGGYDSSIVLTAA